MNDNNYSPIVGIVMGSPSDYDVMYNAALTLKEFYVPFEARVLSAHRTPHVALEYASKAESRGLEVIIAGAGGAAHLAGAMAANTVLPVIGVPLASMLPDGLDALLSTVQMPKGIPVATVAIGKHGAINAAILAVQICANKRPELREKLKDVRMITASELLNIKLPI
jgi:phosphoribosylaminoimidazole carboxylase PurE protein